ncbi:MobA/MobL family protein [Eubacteriales bacterium OttesenSCG-928-K08]|nr:MobA/MobL family protein [Eubacteriales bacterium OttesenSCG-928-K08]
MAIYHCSVKIISRSAGRSSVAAAAYRSGEKLHNERDGLTHDYTRKSGVVHNEIILPEGSPTEFRDRSILWNAVEKAEKRIDAQTAREVEIALPVEFSLQEQIEVLREYVQDNFVSKGMCADVAIHEGAPAKAQRSGFCGEKEQQCRERGVGADFAPTREDGHLLRRNPHAHILLTMREVTPSGFGKKNRGWNDKAHLEKWRENWADVCNTRLLAKGHERIDYRSLEAQGIDREPTIHVGYSALAIEAKGRTSERAQENRAIIERNKGMNAHELAEYLHELKACHAILDKQIMAIKQEEASRKDNLRRLYCRAEDIEEQATDIRALGEKIAELETKKQGMGLFQSKKEINTQISGLYDSLTRAQDHFVREFRISHEYAEHEITRITAEAAALRQMPEADFKTLLDNRHEIEKEYRAFTMIAQMREDRKDIADTLKRLHKEEAAHSVKDMLALSNAERKLSEKAKGNRLPTHGRER